MVLAFRGTESDYKDILTDMRVTPTRSDLLKGAPWVHKGFEEALKDILETPLLGMVTGPMPLYITGHSLGGALATLMGAYLVDKRQAPTEIVTFGSPKPGYGGGLRKLLRNTKQTRVVNGNDLVPSHPYLGSHTVGETEAIKVGATSFWDRWVSPTQRFLDHKISRYMASLA